MSLHVDADGKVHEVEEAESSGVLAQGGHRLGDSAAAAVNRFELPRIELPHIEVPTAFYVALGVIGVAAVGAPLIGLYLVARSAKAAGQAAAALAPAVAQAGPALLPFVPEAAPVVAAASLLAATRGGAPAQPPPPSPTSLSESAATIARVLGTIRGAAESAPPSSEAPTQVFLRVRGTHPAPSVAAASPAIGSTTLVSPR